MTLMQAVTEPEESDTGDESDDDDPERVCEDQCADLTLEDVERLMQLDVAKVVDVCQIPVRVVSPCSLSAKS